MLGPCLILARQSAPSRLLLRLAGPGTSHAYPLPRFALAARCRQALTTQYCVCWVFSVWPGRCQFLYYAHMYMSAARLMLKTGWVSLTRLQGSSRLSVPLGISPQEGSAVLATLAGSADARV